MKRFDELFEKRTTWYFLGFILAGIAFLAVVSYAVACSQPVDECNECAPTVIPSITPDLSESPIAYPSATLTPQISVEPTVTPLPADDDKDWEDPNLCTHKSCNPIAEQPKPEPTLIPCSVTNCGWK